MDASSEMLLFLHIPKTAGTTVRTYLEQQFEPGEAFRLDWQGPSQTHHYFSEPEESRRRLRLISGHMMFGVHRHLDRPCRYVTLLRNPIDRIVSYYYFARSFPGMYMHETASRMGLAEFALSDATAELDNFQVRMLCNKSGAPIGSLTAGDLRQAKQNLQSHFDVVGVQDDVSGFLSAVSKRFGLTRRRIPAQNVTLNRPKLAAVPRAATESIRRRNALDMELYEYVKSTLAPESAPEGTWQTPMRLAKAWSAAALALLPAMVPAFLRNAAQPSGRVAAEGSVSLR